MISTSFQGTGCEDSGDWYNDIPQELEECTIQKNFIQDRVVVPQFRANKIISQDVYLCQLQKIIDHALASVAAKIAQKKEIELNNQKICAKIAKLKENIEKEKKLHKSIRQQIEEEQATTKGSEQEVKELRCLKNIVFEKTFQEKSEASKALQKVEENYIQLKKKADKEKKELVDWTANIEKDRLKTKQKIHELNQEILNSTGEIAKKKAKLAAKSKNEKERIKLIKEKTKILNLLIEEVPCTNKMKNIQTTYGILEKQAYIAKPALSKLYKNPAL